MEDKNKNVRLPALLRNREASNETKESIAPTSLVNILSKTNTNIQIQSKILQEITLVRKLTESNLAFNRKISDQNLVIVNKVRPYSEKVNRTEEKIPTKIKEENQRSLFGDVKDFAKGMLLPFADIGKYMLGMQNKKELSVAGGIEPGSESEKQRDREALADAIANKLAKLLGVGALGLGGMGGGAGGLLGGLPIPDLPGRTPAGTTPGKTQPKKPTGKFPYRWNPRLKGGGGWIDEKGRRVSKAVVEEAMKNTAKMSGARILGGILGIGGIIGVGMTSEDVGMNREEEEEQVTAYDTSKQEQLQKDIEKLGLPEDSSQTEVTNLKQKIKTEALFDKLPDNIKANLKTEKVRKVSSGRGTFKEVKTGEKLTAEEIYQQKKKIVDAYFKPGMFGGNPMTPEKAALIKGYDEEFEMKRYKQGLTAGAGRGSYGMPLAVAEEGVDVVDKVQAAEVSAEKTQDGLILNQLESMLKDLTDGLGENFSMEKLNQMMGGSIISNNVVTQNSQSFVPISPSVDNTADSFQRFLQNSINPY